jgi:hypothetical protein
MIEAPTPSRRLSARARAMLSRRRIGRAVMVAAVVAAVICVMGAVLAWQLLGDLRNRSSASLRLVQSTLTNADASLVVAHDVATTVGGSLDTLRASLATLSADVHAGAAAIDSFAALTKDVPPALDRLDTTLAGLHDAAGTVDNALGALATLPFGPHFDANAGLAASVAGVRDDIRPIADDLRNSTTSLRDLSDSSDDLITELAALDDDLTQLDRSLSRSTELLDTYRSDTADATALAEHSLHDLDRDITLSRALAVTLALAIAVGQVAPFHIGRQLARDPDQVPENLA